VKKRRPSRYGTARANNFLGEASGPGFSKTNPIRSRTRRHPSALAELIAENVLPYSKGQVIFRKRLTNADPS
jgi:hypothetical protein